MIISATYVVCTSYMLLPFKSLTMKPDMSKITYRDAVFAELPPLNGYQRLVFGYFFFIIPLLPWPTFAPKNRAATKLISSIGNIGILALSVVIFVGAKTITRRGKVITMQMLGQCGITWSLISLLSAALFIAGAITDESTGISLYLTEVIPHCCRVQPLPLYFPHPPHRLSHDRII